MKALPIYWTIFFITMIVWLFSDWKTALVVPVAFVFILVVMFLDDKITKQFDGKENGQ